MIPHLQRKPDWSKTEAESSMPEVQLQSCFSSGSWWFSPHEDSTRFFRMHPTLPFHIKQIWISVHYGLESSTKTLFLHLYNRISVSHPDLQRIASRSHRLTRNKGIPGREKLWSWKWSEGEDQRKVKCINRKEIAERKWRPKGKGQNQY